MYVPYNPNPKHNRTRDCTVRAIALATDTDWDTAYIALTVHGFLMKDMPDSDAVWWDFLLTHGFEYHAIMSECPQCQTVAEFCENHPQGKYILATQEHVLCAIDGNWHDAWDSADEIVLHFFTEANTDDQCLPAE